MIRICRFLPDQEIVQCFGIRLCGKARALARSELHNAIPPFGRAHDSPQGGNILQFPCHYSIRGNHKVFDELGGAVLLLLYDVDHLFIQHQWMNFVRLKV